MSHLTNGRPHRARAALEQASRFGLDPAGLARFASGHLRSPGTARRWLDGWDEWEAAPDLTIQTLCCDRDTPMAVWTLASLLASLRRKVKIRVLDDGSMTRRDHHLLATNLPVEFVPAPSVEKVEHLLCDCPIAASYRVRNEHLWARKLMDPVLLSDEELIFVVDTDIAWFGPSPELERWIAHPDEPLFWTTYKPTNFVFKGGVPLPEKMCGINTGVALFQRSSYSFSRLEQFCDRIGPQMGPSLIDQPGYAWILGDGPFARLDRHRYSTVDAAGPECVARHYTGPRREQFWSEGVARLAAISR